MKRCDDLTGQRFGKLIAREQTHDDRGRLVWRCDCDCGGSCLRQAGQLRAGNTVSCGCEWRRSALKAGERFGRLTAIRPTEERNQRSVIWECLCDCGNTVYIRATNLASGHSTSCGCVKAEIDRERDFKKILTYVDDTCLEFASRIAEPRSSDSSDTHVRGVIRLKNGAYRATIAFRKKRYSLGCYRSLEAAVKARKAAEQKVLFYIENNYGEEEVEFVRDAGSS